jgi:transposase
MTHKIKRYSEGFKRVVVSEYETGSELPALQKKYGIRGSNTIPRWIRQYGSQGFRHELIRIQTTQEVNQIKELEQQVEELQHALGRVTLEKLRLESTLEVLSERAEEQVKKNARSSSRSSSKKPATPTQAE